MVEIFRSRKLTVRDRLSCVHRRLPKVSISLLKAAHARFEACWS